MKTLNKLHPGYYSWKYPSCWFKNIKIFFSHIKYAFQRMKRGYADSDVWDLDYYFLTLFAESLSQFANEINGFPDNTFNTPEDWSRYILKIAQLFYQANDMNDYYEHPISDKVNEYLDYDIEHITNNIPEDLTEQWINESAENEKKRKEDFKKAWEMMGEVFFDLWD